MVNRPLPPIPRSQNRSTDFGYLDSRRVQSQNGSEQNLLSDSRRNSNATEPRRDSLNPLAKPFVFGARPLSRLTDQGDSVISSEFSGFATHKSRAASISSTLNAAAQEFKPTGFTFRPPPGVPQFVMPMSIPSQETSRPLPIPPVSLLREEQGREKRQRTSLSPENEVATDYDQDTLKKRTLSSFKFPLNSPSSHSPTRRRSAPTSPRMTSSRKNSSLNASAKPFTFSGFSHMPSDAQPLGPNDMLNLDQELGDDILDDDNFISLAQADYEGSDGYSTDSEIQLPVHNASKQKRAPIPLDFKHPVSTNMVPAGLFKN